MFILTLEYLQCWNHQELLPHRMAASVAGEAVSFSIHGAGWMDSWMFNWFILYFFDLSSVFLKR